MQIQISKYPNIQVSKLHLSYGIIYIKIISENKISSDFSQTFQPINSLLPSQILTLGLTASIHSINPKENIENKEFKPKFQYVNYIIPYLFIVYHPVTSFSPALVVNASTFSPIVVAINSYSPTTPFFCPFECFLQAGLGVADFPSSIFKISYCSHSSYKSHI